MQLKSELPGLSASEVEKSRQKYGRNVIQRRKPVSKLTLFLSQFKSPLIVILLIASLFTLLLSEYLDFAAIIIVVLVNSLLGFYQENRAQNALQALQKIIKPEVKVIRDGEEQTVSAEELVVGDLVRLKLGDRIPADGEILEEVNLTVSESVLTGESAPVAKQSVKESEDVVDSDDDDQFEVDEVYMGTVVLSGFAHYRVTEVASNTEFGKIAATLSEKSQGSTPLQERLEKFSKQIAVVVAVITVVIFIVGYTIAGLEIAELLTLSVSLAVAAIPEGMPIALTVILTVSMQRLLKRNALVRKLIVAETLGSVSTICVDKTGTITQGVMRIADVDTDDEGLFKKTVLSVNNELNAVDVALKKWLDSDPDISEDIFADDEQIAEVPFDSKSKFSMGVHKQTLYVLGAPDILLEKSTLSEEEQKQLQEKMEAVASEGKRLVAAAYRENNGAWSESASDEDIDKYELLQDLNWLGFVTIEDPVRTNVLDAFKEITGAGVAIKIITGDQKATALKVLEEVGIKVKEEEIMSGKELREVEQEQLQQRLPKLKLFYRTSPDQKLQIVEALRANGHVVGMMGDGINDAPALKKASVGIAVDNATEVSKETADIVLLDNNISTIGAAIEEGRAIFENLRKVITYLLSGATSSVLLVMSSIAFGVPIPLTPLQILYRNIINDGPPDIALAFEPAEDNLMKQKPRDKKASLLDNEVLTLIGIIGFVVNFVIFAIYYILYQNGADLTQLRSFVFMLLGIDSLLYVYSVRSLRKNIWETNIFANKTLNLAVFGAFVCLISAAYIPVLSDILELVPLSLSDYGLILLLAMMKIGVIEIVKTFFKPKVS
jgi:Ca2+-transporting ATPase